MKQVFLNKSIDWDSVVVFDDGKWVATLMLNKHAEHKYSIDFFAATFKLMGKLIPSRNFASTLREVVGTCEHLKDKSSVIFESTLDNHCAFMYNIEYARLTMKEIQDED